MRLALALLLGFAGWPLVEHAVHGWLSHGVRGPIARLHASHHVNPRLVFTPASAWIPAALALFALLGWPLGPGCAAAAVAGLVIGFRRYERIHYQIHFGELHGARALRLRQHHLAHHLCNGRAYFGVTQRLTDRLFGSLPACWREDYARVADCAALSTALPRERAAGPGHGAA